MQRNSKNVRGNSTFSAIFHLFHVRLLVYYHNFPCMKKCKSLRANRVLHPLFKVFCIFIRTTTKYGKSSRDIDKAWDFF